MNIKTVEDVKYFLRAKTVDGLQVLMVENNIKTQAYHDYQVFFDGKIWYAMYEGKADAVLLKMVNGRGSTNGK